MMDHYARIAALIAEFKARHDLAEYFDESGRVSKTAWIAKDGGKALLPCQNIREIEA